MCELFDLSAMDAYLLATVPRFAIGAAGGATSWNRATVLADLRAALAEDDADRDATEDLIGRLYKINVTHIGWYCLGVRSTLAAGEVIARPD